MHYYTIHLEIDLLKKFNLNLGYIQTRALDLNNQDNILYKTSFNKLIEMLQNDNFVIVESKDKLC